MKGTAAQKLLEELKDRSALLTLSDVGEKRLLRNFLLPLCEAVCGDYGLANDAGIMKVEAGRDIVVSTDRIPTDLLAERFGLMGPCELGAYLVRANLSDLAATGGTPLGIVVTSAFPSATRVSFVLDVMYGVYTESERFNCPVIGGDTKSSGERSLSATAFGTVPSGKGIGRGPVRAGMTVYLSGPVGHGGAALRWFNQTADERAKLGVDAASVSFIDQELRERIVLPVPRLDLVTYMLDSACPAAMDITDGLGQSLREMAEFSGVALIIEEEHLRLLRSARIALNAMGVSVRSVVEGIGLDLELVVIATNNPAPSYFYEIGTVQCGPAGVFWSDGSEFSAEGFEHFGRSAIDFLR